MLTTPDKDVWGYMTGRVPIWSGKVFGFGS